MDRRADETTAQAPAPIEIDAIPRHPVWPPAYAGLAAAAMLGLDRWAPGTVLLEPPWIWGGLLPLAAAGGLALLAEWRFWRAHTPVLPNRTPKALVTTGVFAISRNPMYLAMAWALAGLWLWLGSLNPGLLIPTFMLVIQRLFIRREERRLEAVFGDAFRNYRRRVRRWV